MAGLSLFIRSLTVWLRMHLMYEYLDPNRENGQTELAP